jgi:hypothetical protein
MSGRWWPRAGFAPVMDSEFPLAEAAKAHWRIESTGHIGKIVLDTVPGWLAARPGQPVAMAHLDLDTYTPTAFVLAAIRPRLVPGSILLFDELYGYPGWRQHEWRALTETLPEGSYRFVAFSAEAVAIRIETAVL